MFAAHTAKRVTSGGAHISEWLHKNFHFAFQHCDWLEHLLEYAASNQQKTEKFCFIDLDLFIEWRKLHALLANALAQRLSVKINSQIFFREPTGGSCLPPKISVKSKKKIFTYSDFLQKQIKK